MYLIMIETSIKSSFPHYPEFSCTYFLLILFIILLEAIPRDCFLNPIFSFQYYIHLQGVTCVQDNSFLLRKTHRPT